MYLCLYTYIYVGIDFVDLTVKGKGFIFWEEFWNVRLLMTEFDCPEVTLCSWRDVKKSSYQPTI